VNEVLLSKETRPVHPYSDLPERQYWRRASSRWVSGDFSGVYLPRFAIEKTTAISTAGSCFAQHVSRNLKKRGYRFLDFEPAPPLLPAELHGELGYGQYSARYGNIYTTLQLGQLLRAAFGSMRVDEVWETRGRFFDPLRPRIEPNGFGSAAEVLRLREAHHAAVRQLVKKTAVFVFTLGLTEVWINKSTGLAYPTCPGTVAGTFNAEEHVFKNLGFSDVLLEMVWIIKWWTKNVNPGIKFLLTVSPVPLAATAEAQHVVTSTTYSKSVLRAVAGELCQKYDSVDYFPSYELITSHLGKGTVYAANMRDVLPEAVEEVMQCFFAAHGDAEAPSSSESSEESGPRLQPDDVRLMNEMKVICEEAELDQDAR
jgi:hypothetical protein